MKRLLLDTHVLLWWLSQDERLGAAALEAIAEPRNEVFVSAVTTWEIALKRSIGKLEAPTDMETVIEEERFRKLPITLAHGDRTGALPHHHRDPFDRMLVAQAQIEELTIVTADQRIREYEVSLLRID